MSWLPLRTDLDLDFKWLATRNTYRVRQKVNSFRKTQHATLQTWSQCVVGLFYTRLTNWSTKWTSQRRLWLSSRRSQLRQLNTRLTNWSTKWTSQRRWTSLRRLRSSSQRSQLRQLNTRLTKWLSKRKIWGGFDRAHSGAHTGNPRAFCIRP